MEKLPVRERAGERGNGVKKNSITRAISNHFSRLFSSTADLSSEARKLVIEVVKIVYIITLGNTILYINPSHSVSPDRGGNFSFKSSIHINLGDRKISQISPGIHRVWPIMQFQGAKSTLSLPPSILRENDSIEVLIFVITYINFNIEKMTSTLIEEKLILL